MSSSDMPAMPGNIGDMMKRLNSRTEQLQQLMESITLPSMRLMEQAKKAMDTWQNNFPKINPELFKLAEQIRVIQSPVQEMLQGMKKWEHMLPPVKPEYLRAVESIEKWQKQLPVIYPQMQRMLEDSKKWPINSELLKLQQIISKSQISYNDSIKHLSSQLSGISLSLERHAPLLKGIQQSMLNPDVLNILRQLAEEKVEFLPDGSISLNGKIFPEPVGVHEAGTDIVAEKKTNYRTRKKYSYKNTTEWLKNFEATPEAWAFILTVLLALYVGGRAFVDLLYQPLIEAAKEQILVNVPAIAQVVEKYSHNNDRVPLKAIQDAAAKDINREALKFFRIVTAAQLQVRKTAKQNGQQIAILYFGQTVRIIEKKKSWALVEYEDTEAKIHIQGWVFARYLGKLR